MTMLTGQTSIETATWGLTVPFACLVLVGVLFLRFAYHRRPFALGDLRRSALRLLERLHTLLLVDRGASAAAAPEWKLRQWLAVRSDQPTVVGAALGLSQASLCTWEEGVALLDESRFFITPSVRGWVIVLAHDLPEPGQDVDALFRLLLRLSRRLGEVHYYLADTAKRSHGWVRVTHHTVLRAYVWSGKTVWNQGEITDEEVDLDMVCLGYGEEADHAARSGGGRPESNLSKVQELACRWSLDPASVAAAMAGKGRGLLGSLGYPKLR